jgi:hypothetical protein
MNSAMQRDRCHTTLQAKLNCAEHGDSSVITGFAFAAYGLPTGTCTLLLLLRWNAF